ncbi:probable protein phosphatase 2C 24 [Salvia hispanica]|uniref:probable protein phosphatase 2C 24 n=1 Tax=Salvia hispanica TaxID=49212 RepID=UPI002009BAE0|nr:probable protein phosphatase 2C 24 [Salvia hispanica]XP_047977096.1 probable protein phosphatase 2C 24 [Salvia hispanica]
MAEICCESEGSCETSSRAARRRRMELRRVRVDPTVKRRRLQLQLSLSSSPKHCDNKNDILPKFGFASVCGRRRDMEDAVASHPSFCRNFSDDDFSTGLHYFGVYDGHGCSHVATKCKERLHEMVKEELLVGEDRDSSNWWKCVMERSFTRMDKEAVAWNENVATASCRCELQMPECDAVGSTAVVAVVSPCNIVVANCGDSRAVLCRSGKAIPLSTDHKPDRPDEMNRIQAAGGRVIFWEGARVLGVLAMSRAIGDNYLKPYVSCEPEVTITERSEEDECLILASDGLWDVVSNDTACGVARMCLKGKEGSSDKACNDASMLLTKLALARRSADNVTVLVIDLT